MREVWLYSYGQAGETNASGDDVKKLDLISNEIMVCCTPFLPRDAEAECVFVGEFAALVARVRCAGVGGERGTGAAPLCSPARGHQCLQSLPRLQQLLAFVADICR